MTKDIVLTDAEKVQRIRTLIGDYRVAKSLDEDKISALKAAVDGIERG